MLRFFGFLLLLACLGCDSSEERPLTIGERVAGTWEIERVRDGNTIVTQQFEEAAGTAVFDFESVGCCAATAAYRLAVTRPGGEVHEVEARYRVNDNPDTANFFSLSTGESAEGILFIYEFDRSYNELTISAGMQGQHPAALETLGLLYPFEEEFLFHLRRL